MTANDHKRPQMACIYVSKLVYFIRTVFGTSYLDYRLLLMEKKQTHRI